LRWICDRHGSAIRFNRLHAGREWRVNSLAMNEGLQSGSNRLTLLTHFTSDLLQLLIACVTYLPFLLACSRFEVLYLTVEIDLSSPQIFVGKRPDVSFFSNLLHVESVEIFQLP
jgi:hypothetical protein